MKVYFVTSDNGDGSSSVHWFREDQLEALDVLLEEEESYYSNEGTPDYITLPDDFDLSTLGVSFRKT